MDDFTENDLRSIERDRDLPPDEPYPLAPDELLEDEQIEAPDNPVTP
jgi:hypothetical protein